MQTQQPVQSRFNGYTTAAQVMEGLDLVKKYALVTGAASGIGRETARALAAAGAHVTLAVRNVDAGENVARELRDLTGNSAIEVSALDLMSPTSIKSCVDRYIASGKPLHVLINNAGVMACPLERNAEGIESQLQSNALGPLQLSLALADLLVSNAPSRIVMVSSTAHQFSPVVLGDLNYEHRPYDPMQAYGQSKTAITLFNVELQRRFGPLGLTCLAVHPGIIETNLMRHMSREALEKVAGLATHHPNLFKSIEAGAATSVWAATAPELTQCGGAYLEDCQIAKLIDSPNMINGVARYALDSEVALQLWDVVVGTQKYSTFGSATK